MAENFNGEFLTSVLQSVWGGGALPPQEACRAGCCLSNDAVEVALADAVDAIRSLSFDDRLGELCA